MSARIIHWIINSWLPCAGMAALLCAVAGGSCSGPAVLPEPDTTPIPGGGAWRQFASPPVAFHEAAAAVIGESLYYVGGRLPNGPIASLYRYDPTPINSWSQLASHPGAPVDHMGAVVVDGLLYAIGGTEEFPGPSVRAAYRYDPATNQWRGISPLPVVLGAMGIGAVNGKIYCIGGLSGSQATDYVFEYDPPTDTWTDLTGVCPMPTARDHSVAAVVDGRIHVIGGRTVTIASIIGAHEAFDPASRTWQSLSPLPTPRAGFASAVLGGRILVMGGEGSGFAGGVFSVVEEYDPATDTWRRLSPMTTPRHSTQAGVIDDVVYVAAGAPVIGRTYTDVNEGFAFKFE